jgi:oligopeptide transport system substrate-binding protein
VFPDTPSDLRRAQYLKDQLGSGLGITLQLQALDTAAYGQAIDTGNYDLALGGWSADYPDPQDWLGPVFACQGPFNRTMGCDAAFDQVVARADTAVSLTDRLRLYAQAQIQLMQDVPVAPLFTRGRLVLVKPWVASVDGGPLKLTPLDDYPGSLFLDQARILPH